ncbi:MAG: pilus assembly protein PilZ [Treponema sp.]|nr:pilus assembly protein PilZ [Treponema sp.]
MSENESSVSICGRKVFFLNPLPPIQNIVVDELIQREYEAYIVNDRAALKRVLKDSPGSIIFVDIDQVIGEKEWESWIREITTSGELQDTRIGILTANRNDALQNKYTNVLHLPCGYTMIHRDLNITTAQVVNILNANDAKGRRKYLRTSMGKEALAVVNFPIGGRFIGGSIKDISTAGFSCAFVEDPGFSKNSAFSNVQIKLKHIILNVEAVIFGSRTEGNNKVYVALFTDRLSPDSKVKIRKYIQSNLQEKVDALMV